MIMNNKIIKKIHWLLHEYFMNRSFKKFGHNSYLTRPYMLTNPQCIVIEENVVIRGYSRIEAIVHDGYTKFNPAIKIGKNTKIEQYFHVGACELVEIGENVLIASRVFISDHNHCFSDINIPIKQQGITAGGKVVIERNVWLCEGCVILPGLTIGRNSVVGANAVVKRNIPPYSVAVGIPAKVIKQFDFNLGKWIATR